MVITYAGAGYKRKTRANYMLGRVGRAIASNARRSLSGFRRFGLANNISRKRVNYKPRNLTVAKGSQGVRWWPRIFQTPMPTMMNRQLKWCSERRVVSNASGGICGTAHDYYLNGLYQISASGGSNVQPMGFDEMMAFYNSYRVYKVEMKIRFCKPTNILSQVGIAQIRASNDNTTAGVIAGRYWNELNQRSNVATIQVDNDDFNENTIFRTLYISEIEGQSIVDNNYTGRYDLNPTNKPLLKIGCCDSDGNGTGSLTYHVEFIFHTTFFDKKSLEMS